MDGWIDDVNEHAGGGIIFLSLLTFGNVLGIYYVSNDCPD